MAAKFGIYVHIPFCLSKCRYCDFASYEGCEHLTDDYFEALHSEIALRAQSMAGRTADTVFFGGGTPPVPGIGRLTGLLQYLACHCRIDPAAEITVEANPGSIPQDDCHNGFNALRAAGFNRLSFGLQAVQNNLLKVLGRIHSFRELVVAFRAARVSGFGNINIDVIFGIPGQTGADWRQTLESIVELQPEHISAYALQLEEGTPLADDVHAGRVPMPDDDETAGMYWDAHRILTHAGFVHYEISNFARPGFECRHNLLYWDSDDYVGLGSAAHSHLGGYRSANHENPAVYLAELHSGVYNPAHSELTGMAERIFEYLMLKLRTSRGVSKPEFHDRFGTGVAGLFRNLSRYREQGLLEETEEYVRFTPAGWAVSNAVMADILPD